MASVKVFLQYPEESTGEPLLSGIVRKFDIDFNILQASIKPSRQGRLTAELVGSQENIEKAIEYLREKGLTCRIYNKSIIRNEEKCVNCGFCSAVCPGKALKLTPGNWELEFDNSKCLLCELCVKTCPLGAMSVEFFDEHE